MLGMVLYEQDQNTFYTIGPEQFHYAPYAIGIIKPLHADPLKIIFLFIGLWKLIK